MSSTRSIAAATRPASPVTVRHGPVPAPFPTGVDESRRRSARPRRRPWPSPDPGCAATTCRRSSRRNERSVRTLPSRFGASSRSVIAWTSSAPSPRVSLVDADRPVERHAALPPDAASNSRPRPSASTARSSRRSTCHCGSPVASTTSSTVAVSDSARSTLGGMSPTDRPARSSVIRTCSPTASRSRRNAASPWRSAHALTRSTASRTCSSSSTHCCDSSSSTRRSWRTADRTAQPASDTSVRPGQQVEGGRRLAAASRCGRPSPRSCRTPASLRTSVRFYAEDARRRKAMVNASSLARQRNSSTGRVHFTPAVPPVPAPTTARRTPPR